MFTHYLTIARRHLLKHKGYSLINILGLAVGLACCMLILLYVQDELGYDRHYPYADRMYRLADEREINGAITQSARTPAAWGPALVREYPEVLSTVRIKTPSSQFFIKYEDRAFWERGFYFADESVFEVFGYNLLRGDPNTALSEPNTVVITEAIARKYFGDEDPIGKVFNGEELIFPRVTGIIEDPPRNGHIHFDFLVSFRSLDSQSQLYGNLYDPDIQTGQGLGASVYTYLLLQEDYPAADLTQKLPGFIDKYLGERLRSRGMAVSPFLQPVTDIHLHSNLDGELEANSDIRYIYIFSALALFIILIACINFMNLATARSANRAHEVGMRKVVGAHHGQLMRQFLGESLFLAAIAAVVGLGLVYLMMPVFNDLSGKDLEMDLVMMVPGLAGIALLAGLLSGSYPAVFLSAFKPASVLKGSLKLGSANALLRKILVMSQFAVSVVMIVGTVTVYEQLSYLRNIRLGFDKEHVVTIRLANQEIANRYDSYRSILTQRPDVVDATGAFSEPGGVFPSRVVRPQGGNDSENRSLLWLITGHDYVKTMGMEMAAGRDFSRDFSTDERGAVLINETAARAFGWEDPIGKELEVANARRPQSYQVIGVVRDFHIKSLHHRIEPVMMTVSRPPNTWFGFIRIRDDNISDTLAALESTWRDVYPIIPFEYSFLDQNFDNLYRAEERLGGIFGAFALFSLFVTCLGLFGLASFMAEQHIKEIGIRKVLGASVTDVVVMMSGGFTRLVVIAVVLAGPLAYIAMDRWLQDFAYHIDISPWTFLLAGITALLIAWVTVGYQAIRAGLTNPVDTLRAE